MMHNLVEIALQRAGQFVDLSSGFIIEWNALQTVLQFIDQFGRDTREIVDEIERVLDLVRDTGSELAKQGEFLGLHKAILRCAQFLQGLCQFARTSLNLVEQSRVFDSDYRLVGKSRNEFDLLFSECTRSSPAEYDHADRCSFAQQRDSENRAQVANVSGVSKLVFGIVLNIYDMDGFAVKNRSSGDRPACQLNPMSSHELVKFVRIAETCHLLIG